MSLINDALKKAARQRASEEADLSNLMPGGGGGRSGRDKKPMKMQTMVLIGAAAVVLVILSAVVTGVLVTGKPSSPAPSPVVAAPTSIPVASQAGPAVTVQMPTISLPKTIAATPVPTTAPIVAARPTPTAVPTAAPALVVVAAPVTEVHTPQPAAPAPLPAAAPVDQSHNDQIQAIVDALLISGARAAGSGSKALINGHVYRLNDLIDKATGLRLKGVDVDHLTLVDATGAIYTKSF